jgi:septum formation topological specificity factor MinE
MPNFSKEQIEFLLEKEKHTANKIKEKILEVEERDKKNPDNWNKFFLNLLKNTQKFVDIEHPRYIPPEQRNMGYFLELELEMAKFKKLSQIVGEE